MSNSPLRKKVVKFSYVDTSNGGGVSIVIEGKPIKKVVLFSYVDASNRDTVAVTVDGRSVLVLKVMCGDLRMREIEKALSALIQALGYIN